MDVFDEGVVWESWGGVEHRSSGGLALQPRLSQTFFVFVEGFLSFIVIRHRLLGLARAESFALGIREAEIGAFPDAAHFFTLSPSSTSRRFMLFETTYRSIYPAACLLMPC